MKVLMVVLIILALAAGGIGLWYGLGSSNTGPAYRTAVVERGSLLATVSATGTVEPEEVVDVGAQVAGQIKRFGRDPRDSSKAIDYGSQVEAGTILAQLDDALYAADVEQAKADLGQSQALLQR